MQGIEIDRVRAEICLFWVRWSIGLVFVWVVVVENGLGFWMRALIRLVLVWRPKLTWFSSGWSIFTWFPCGGPNLAWFQFRDHYWFVLCLGDRKWLGFGIWVEVDLDVVWWCSTANRYEYRVLTDRCVCYVLEDHPVTVDRVAQWFVLCKRTKEVRVSNSSHGWLSGSMAYSCKRTTEVCGSNPTEVVFQFFSVMHFSEIYLHTTGRP